MSRTTVDEAEQLLKSEHATTWMNLVVCDRDDAAVFEITPDRVGRRDDEQGVLRCTNHFRCEGLSVGEECWRYDTLVKSSDPEKPAAIADVHRLLDAVNQGNETLQTMVFEPRELAIHLALGTPPVSADPLTRIDLRPLFNVAEK